MDKLFLYVQRVSLFWEAPFLLIYFKSILLDVTMLYWLLFHNNYSVIEGIYDIISLLLKGLYYSLDCDRSKGLCAI